MTLSSLAGQAIVGQYVTVPWWPGHWEITQGWGPTDYSGEPEGHGYTHWHAGVDIAVPCGTIISLPPLITSAAVRYVDNPGGYGTAIVLTVGRVDIWFGHLAARLAPPGTVRGGAHLAATNNSGNSTGCHVHVEVRPQGARYGTDIDPSAWLLDPEGAAAGQGQAAGAASRHRTGPGSPGSDVLAQGDIPGSTSGAGGTPLDALAAAVEQGVSAAFQPVETSIETAERQFVAGLVGSAQVGLGAVMMAGGVVAVWAGYRGQGVRQLAAGALGAQRRLGAAVQRPTPAAAPAAATEPPKELSASAQAALAEARAGRGARLSPEVAEELRRQSVRASRVKGARAPRMAPAAHSQAGDLVPRAVRQRLALRAGRAGR